MNEETGLEKKQLNNPWPDARPTGPDGIREGSG